MSVFISLLSMAVSSKWKELLTIQAAEQISKRPYKKNSF